MYYECTVGQTCTVEQPLLTFQYVQWNNSGAFFTFRSEIPYHFKLRIPELSLKNSEEGNWKDKILYNFFLLYAKKNSLNSSFWSHLFFLSGAKGILLVIKKKTCFFVCPSVRQHFTFFVISREIVGWFHMETSKTCGDHLADFDVNRLIRFL